ncbi:endosome/lysosome-associated apoptosis and autophagy regulator 1 [Protopterus annectens]|uniref:endosome/lysosome-associated apoptosis and autophagy regulator 1 n=1 Tax=Protopterus annectens TaxID=7888 RepID=UPI001CFBC81B|nr:endosome/lysosome-associated apoptosis and autophagy regulator 1 [Protopterus annectens]
MKEQMCKQCATGTYSLGTGVRIDEWDELPPGFANMATNLVSEDMNFDSVENCTMSKWVPMGDYIASNRDECTATLVYAVSLKQSGTVSFEYFYPDPNIYFEFYIQNDQCQAADVDSRWMKVTENEWQTNSVQLNRGNNVLYWKTTAFSVKAKLPKPVLLRNIMITGVAYTSECFPCNPGTYASNPGTSVCSICPRNTFTSKGATGCQECSKEQYSEKRIFRKMASSSCYIKIKPCNTDGQTQRMYKWTEPKICSEDTEGAVKLPASGTKTPCPPCNPGYFQINSSVCEPCPYGSYSNGSVCTKCPAGTEPILGLEYKWWNVLPSDMETSILNVEKDEYEKTGGWVVAEDHIFSGAGSSDRDYIILTLNIAGFRPPQSITQVSENREIGQLSFVFEMLCTEACELYFMVGMDGRSGGVVESWVGQQDKQPYHYIIQRNSSVSFTWAFQRTSQHGTERRFSGDIAKIYSVNVTNVMDGVSSYCLPCALGSSDSSSLCTSCPPGNYIDKASSSCFECPVNTYLESHRPYGKQACVSCGPGTKSNQVHSLCYNDCKFIYKHDNRTFRYDFSALKNATSYSSAASFTPKGLKYYREFQIGLCGNKGTKLATCIDNVTDIRISGADSKTVTSFICQATIVSSEVMGYKTVVSSQPVSLADQLLGVSIQTVLNNITSPEKIFPRGNNVLRDVIFFYRSTETTQVCSTGRATTIRMRCDPLKVGSGVISAPSKCPEGTCDGCTFHFLWESAEACPLCTEMDFHEIASACIHGIQKTTYVWQQPKLCKDGITLPEETVGICTTMDFWLKVGIALGICAALLLIVITCYFWKKNQKLEYKYSKLVINANMKESELPAADSCAIMEGEDAEDDLIFLSKKTLFGKIKSFTSKAHRTSDGFDSVPLKPSSQGITDMDL